MATNNGPFGLDRVRQAEQLAWAIETIMQIVPPDPGTGREMVVRILRKHASDLHRTGLDQIMGLPCAPVDDPYTRHAAALAEEVDRQDG